MVNSSKTYVETWVELGKLQKWTVPEYVTLAKYGKAWERALPRPKGWRKGRVGFCYANAGRVASSDDDYLYCEGYATSTTLPIPLGHAWLMCRSTGDIIDPTWVNGRDYFGLTFDYHWFRKAVVTRKVWGLFFPWEKSIAELYQINITEGATHEHSV